MIYTLGFLKEEAESIAGHWNGEDARFIDASGEVRSEEDVQNANDLLENIENIENIIKELGI